MILIISLFFAALNPREIVVEPRLTRFTFTEYHMGVDTRLVVYAYDRQKAENACFAAFERIAALDTMMSDYRPTSELMRLSDKAGQGPVVVSPDLYKVLVRAQEVSKLSNGLFDVTVGPIVKLWRQARKTHVLPKPEEIERARKLVGWQNLKLDGGPYNVQLMVPGMRLDLGAVAKGYADDEAQKVLRDHGIESALVEMGGDIVVSDPPPGTRGWTIEVPNAGDDKKPPLMFFKNCAISTSGDTEQNVVIGGVLYSHVVDPHTGMALTSRVQATVVCPDGLTADPVSTALTLLSPAERTQFLKHYPGTKTYVKKE